jgi:large subunit ribosomal protein L21
MQTLKHETEDTIRARAHGFWEAEGRPDGRAEIHWQRALETLVEPILTTATSITDVSLIDGVGPKITKLLAEAGITSLQHIAKLTPAKLAKLDEELNLKGRTAREDWIAQAQELIAGKAPRAKVDQAKAKKN